MEGPCEASLSLSHTHIHPHTHAGHSLGGLLGGRLVFELQISVLWLGLLETERQTVRHKPRIPETKTRCFSSKSLAPVALFILGPDQCNQSFSSTAQLDRSGPVCCTQNLPIFNMFFSADLHFPMSYFLGKRHSPGRRSLGPCWPGCTRTQPGR